MKIGILIDSFRVPLREAMRNSARRSSPVTSASSPATRRTRGTASC